MEDHLKSRPNKHVYNKSKVDFLKKIAVDSLLDELLPDLAVLKVVLIGSSLKGSFGEYDPPGFRGSLYSDFDFIVFVKDNYVIPAWLEREVDGRPFPDERMNLAYRSRKFVEDRYDIEVFFVRESSWEDAGICELGEKAGIPMSEASEHVYEVVYG